MNFTASTPDTTAYATFTGPLFGSPFSWVRVGSEFLVGRHTRVEATDITEYGITCCGFSYPWSEVKALIKF